MKVVVFGATGKIGRQLVLQALTQGHQVTAFVRDAAKLHCLHPKLTILQGDIADGAGMRAAVDGADAVICALGAPLFNASGLRARGTAAIMDAMTATGVRRLICLSALGVGESRATLPRRFRWFVLPVILRRVIADHAAQERLIRQSGLDWTIIRPGNFGDIDRTGIYRAGADVAARPGPVRISRGDVADFMLKQLGSDAYLRQAPGLSY